MTKDEIIEAMHKDFVEANRYIEKLLKKIRELNAEIRKLKEEII